VWQLRLFPGVDDLIRNAARDYRVALLSNTNEIYWGQVNESIAAARNLED